MEQVMLATARRLAVKVFAESSHQEIGDWLESKGWRWIGGRWAAMHFPNVCRTYVLWQAVEIQIMLALLKAFGHKPESATTLAMLKALRREK